MKNFGEKGAWAYPGTVQNFYEYPLLSQERVKLRTSNLAGIFTGFMRTKANLKFGRKWSVGVSRDFPKFFEYPLLSQEHVKLQTSNLASISQGPSEQKPFKILGEKGAWAYPGTAPIA